MAEAAADTATEVAAGLRRALARHLGTAGEVQGLRRLSGGATRRTWVFDWLPEQAGQGQGKGGNGTVPRTLVLQQQPASSEPPGRTPKLQAAHEAALMATVRAAGVPAPPVCCVLEPGDGLGEGHVTAHVAGETLARSILREPGLAAARQGMARQCGELLARIHQVPLQGLPFLQRLTAADELAVYGALLDRTGVRHPALDYARRWIADHLPAPQQATLVHADFRLGNLIVDATGVRCVLDWEIARIGDPMQDLGVLCMRSWRFGGAGEVGGFGARDALYAGYEAVSGQRVDPQRVRFWEAFANFKWAVACARRGSAQRADGGPASLELAAIGRRLEEPLWDFLCVPGVVAGPDPAPAAPRPSPFHGVAADGFAAAPRLLQAVAEQLEQGTMPALSGYQAFQARICANVVRLVARELRDGPAMAQAEHTRLLALLGLVGGRAALNDELGRRIANGTLALDAPGLVPHLRQSLYEALCINNPQWVATR